MSFLRFDNSCAASSSLFPLSISSCPIFCISSKDKNRHDPSSMAVFCFSLSCSKVLSATSYCASGGQDLPHLPIVFPASFVQLAFVRL